MTKKQHDNMPNERPQLADFLHAQQLPARYGEIARQWFVPLAEELVSLHQRLGRPLIIGINGSQGSGKSTLASLLQWLFQHRHGLSAIALSIDDFYLSHSERQRLAHEVHPLLATRGVPGTHDVGLMARTLEGLSRGDSRVSIPRFDKATDDPFPQEEWQRVTPPLDMSIIEGWCLGTPPQDESALLEPINELEAEEDPDGRWRRYVNRQIAEQYQPLYQQVDAWIMLKAPSFDCVYQWRLEQEQKLAQRLAESSSKHRVMDSRELARFIAHFQRLTIHGLHVLPPRMHFLYELDAQRGIIKEAGMFCNTLATFFNEQHAPK